MGKKKQQMKYLAKNWWLISDTHFSHENIIQYCNRPFADADEMDAYLIQEWNRRVLPTDTVYHLGDFAWIANHEMLQMLIAKLHGRKYLIMGNHDKDVSSDEEYWREAGFVSAYQSPIILFDYYMLSHEPLFANENMPYVNIHGHIHDLRYADGSHINVSVEQTEYAPVRFIDVLERQRARCKKIKGETCVK